jgi:RNA polymerase sigma-70 factor, ECF subfamily
MTETQLSTIVVGCIRQELKAQEQLYRLCYNEMMKVCTRYTSNLDDAGACYNEAMLKVFTNIDKMRNEGKIIGWIKTIVVNTCIDHCRKKTLFVTRADESIPDVQMEPAVYSKFNSGDIFKMVQQLPKATATVFNLFIYEGYKHEEIATSLKISVGTSKWHVAEAKRLLKNLFAQHPIHSSFNTVNYAI